MTQPQQPCTILYEETAFGTTTTALVIVDNIVSGFIDLPGVTGRPPNTVHLESGLGAGSIWPDFLFNTSAEATAFYQSVIDAIEARCCDCHGRADEGCIFQFARDDGLPAFFTLAHSAQAIGTPFRQGLSVWFGSSNDPTPSKTFATEAEAIAFFNQLRAAIEARCCTCAG